MWKMIRQSEFAIAELVEQWPERHSMRLSHPHQLPER